ncbi:hypothetical protein GCM10010435_90680 [Winogradskya consettensis]|uniref:TIR domain-containing protein n=1 Tax=Winogradskya consettensis TaxID=113560 RepID=A0A919SZP1_9ACTN|nr:TIR-like protein FxsC [Actinoplanes consettensis]GIM79983.1 hypothetical protein Aco04nite_68310 [Actinoplanes consettensis]
MAAAIIDDPGAPVFFLSYARPDRARAVSAPREPNRYVMRFFDELTANVNELVGSPAGQDPGYLDLGHGGGEHWQKAVLHGAGTCQVLVCLLSRPYLFQSNWCPLEWDVFARRKVLPRAAAAPGIESAIVPVLWTPFHEMLPGVTADVNIFRPTGLPDEDYTARYLTDGLFGLLRTGQTEIYEAIVWKLAMHIQRIHSLYWVEPGVPEGIAGLRQSFSEGMP